MAIQNQQFELLQNLCDNFPKYLGCNYNGRCLMLMVTTIDMDADGAKKALLELPRLDNTAKRRKPNRHWQTRDKFGRLGGGASVQSTRVIVIFISNIFLFL